MKTTVTTIVPISQTAAGIIPKPSKAHLVAAMVKQVIEAREAENKLREQKRKVLQRQLDREIEKFKKKTIKIGSLDCRWEYAGAYVAINHHSIEGSQEMKLIAEKIKALPFLTVNPMIIRDEIITKMDNEIIASILVQPGMKTAIQSAVAKLGV